MTKRKILYWTRLLFAAPGFPALLVGLFMLFWGDGCTDNRATLESEKDIIQNEVIVDSAKTADAVVLNAEGYAAIDNAIAGDRKAEWQKKSPWLRALVVYPIVFFTVVALMLLGLIVHIVVFIFSKEERRIADNNIFKYICMVVYHELIAGKEAESFRETLVGILFIVPGCIYFMMAIFI